MWNVVHKIGNNRLKKFRAVHVGGSLRWPFAPSPPPNPQSLRCDPSPITAGATPHLLLPWYLVTRRVVDVNVVRCLRNSREFWTNYLRRAKLKVWFLLKINNGSNVNGSYFSMCMICGFAWDSPTLAAWIDQAKQSVTSAMLPVQKWPWISPANSLTFESNAFLPSAIFFTLGEIKFHYSK